MWKWANAVIKSAARRTSAPLFQARRRLLMLIPIGPLIAIPSIAAAGRSTYADQLAGGTSGETGNDPTSGDPRAPAYLKTTSDIANGLPVSLLRFLPAMQHGAIRERKSTYDCTKGWQTAIQAAKNLRVNAGLYIINATATPQLDQNVEGEGYASEITTALDIEHLSNADVANATNGIGAFTIRNLKLSNTFPVTAGKGATHFHLRLANACNALVDRVWCKSAFGDTDLHVDNHGGIWFDLIGAYPTGFMNMISRSWMDHCHVRIDSSDSEINGSYIWGHTTDYGIQANQGNIRVINNPGIIGSRSHGGVWLTRNAQQAAIQGNFFDGSGDAVNSGYGVFSDSEYPNKIDGNFFWRQYLSGVWLNNGQFNTVQGNTFIDCGRKDGGVDDSDIVINGVTLQPNGNNLANNVHRRSGARAHPVYAVYERSAGTNPTENNISGATVTASANQYATPAYHLAKGSTTSSRQ